MADGDVLIAVALLAALRRDGCVVSADGDTLKVTGTYSDTRRDMIAACKSELLAIVTAEGEFPVTPETAAAEAPSPEPTPPAPASWAPDGLLAMASRRRVQLVATSEWLAWHGRQMAAMRDGRRFNEPEPRWVER